VIAPPRPRRERLNAYRQAREALLPRTSRKLFEQLVAEAMDNLPQLARDQMENVAVVVEERAPISRLTSVGVEPETHDLLGLYEGIPRTDRSGSYHLVGPDRITLYRRSILDQLPTPTSEQAVRDEIRRTLIHEIGHHFGLSDEEIEALEHQAGGH
jgi:predicted Zn-dependent protease with MMP-like domain